MIKMKDLYYEWNYAYDPFNKRANNLGLVKVWRVYYGLECIGQGYTKADAIASARRAIKQLNAE